MVKYRKVNHIILVTSRKTDVGKAPIRYDTISLISISAIFAFFAAFTYTVVSFKATAREFPLGSKV